MIEFAYASGVGYAFWLLVIAALFTSFFSWRLMFMTFYGEPRGDHHAHEHAHESPWTMLVPLGVLALGAVFSGMIGYGSFFGDHNTVNRFFGIPVHAEETADAAHAEAAPAEGAADHAAENRRSAERLRNHDR